MGYPDNGFASKPVIVILNSLFPTLADWSSVNTFLPLSKESNGARLARRGLTMWFVVSWRCEMTEADTKDWPSLAAALYDKLTGKNAEITYEFSDFQVDIPSSTSPDAEHARWRFHGMLKIRTQNGA